MTLNSIVILTCITGSEITVYYDSMIAKIIVHAPTRAEAVRRMSAALARTVILGVTTNQKFLLSIMNNARFQSGTFDTNFIPLEREQLFPKRQLADVQGSVIAATLFQWIVQKSQRVHLRNIQPNWRNVKWRVPSKKYTVNNQEQVEIHYNYQGQQQKSHQFQCKLSEEKNASPDLQVVLYDAQYGTAVPGPEGVQGCAGLVRCSIGRLKT